MRRNGGVDGKGITAFGNDVHRAAEDADTKKRKQVGEHHDGSYGVYMSHKIQKLRGKNDAFIGSSIINDDETALSEMRLQHSEDTTAVHAHATTSGSKADLLCASTSTRDGSASTSSSSSVSTSTLFNGIHIYVDGYTIPSKEEIRGIMLLYGGGFEHYETSRVTHIIATHLSTSKMLQYKKMRHPPPVVRPEWILRCVETKTLLPLQPFLYRAFADPTQASVLSGLSLSLSASTPKSPSRSAPAPVPVQHQNRSTIVDSSSGSNSVPVESTSEENILDHDPDESGHENIFSECEGASDEEDHEALASQYAASQQDVHSTSQCDADTDTDADSSHPAPAATTTTTTTTTTNMTRTNSTRDGPAFVRHFFAKSRLHHIGSWRSTFQQRASEFIAKYKGAPFPRASATSTDRVILHVDMDCFFVSVAVRDKPQYQHGVPVAIAHSGNAGSSEISSCNYVAREKGLRAGMYMQMAKDLCPELVVLPYQFAQIEACSFQIYDIFFTRTPHVQAMSCDEAYLEFAPGTDGVAMATEIRRAIFETTQCTASVGVSYNILLAKLATREAKPDGVFAIATPQQAEPFLEKLQIRELPGVGHRMSATMDELGIETLAQLRAITKSELQHHFGKTTSEMLFQYARGVDTRPLSVESNMTRKSVSTVVNFGIRFTQWSDATQFMMALAEELSSRLLSLKVRTKCLTLLIKKRKPDAPVEPSKFMGMGRCDSFSKSQLLADATDSDLVMGRACIELLRQFQFANVEDLRGVGIQATKLVSLVKPVETKSGQRFRAWLADAADEPQQRDTSTRDAAPSVSDVRGGQENGDTEEPRHEQQRYTESLSQLNMSVLNELPEDIREEVLESYTRYTRNRRTPAPPPPPLPPQVTSVASTTGAGTSRRAAVVPPSRAKGKQKLVRSLPPQSSSSSSSTTAATSTSSKAARNLFRSSSNDSTTSLGNTLNDIRFSQVDEDVYQALPMAIRREIDTHAKKSTGSTRQRRHPQDHQQQRHQAPPPPEVPRHAAKQDLESIEQLFSALADAATSHDATITAMAIDDMVNATTAAASVAVRAAFDAIFSRILMEMEARALDVALRMLRFVRRKCLQLLASVAAVSTVSHLLRSGFNNVLQQINRELHDHYKSSFPERLVAPL